MAGRKQESGRRLSGEQRREEILAAAARAVSDQGYLPLPVEQIAREAGASKALVYAYFPKQVALYNALLRRGLGALAEKLARIKRGGFEAQAAEASLIYFDDVAEHGAVLHLLLTDAHLTRARDADAIALRDSLWRRFLRASRAYVKLPPEERVAALAILLSIPEDLGRMAHRGDLERERARELCRQLTISSLRGLRDDAGGKKR